jgi:ABC transporter with metal-binding/Fe-S-binding domain ATP-binding protein
MKLGVLFSGGKDSTYAAWLAKKAGHSIDCLITLVSQNKESYMFHTPSIELVEKQAQIMDIHLIKKETSGVKEEELIDLEKAIYKAIMKHEIQGVVTGAVESVYQATRIQEICNKLGIECFNPLWQKNQIELLDELIKSKFEAIIVGAFAYPFDAKWLGRKIDLKFIEKIKELEEKYKINPAGEGGEFESFILNCPLFKKPLKVKDLQISGEGNSWRAELAI